MSETTSSPSRRRGGAREAMRAARAAPLPDNLRPVRPGMEGGRYKPLTDADVLKIHHAALDALENIGFADATPSGIEYMTKAGAVLRSDGRLVFPRALVEDTLAHAGRKARTARPWEGGRALPAGAAMGWPTVSASAK